PWLTAFILETTNRFITVVFKFVPLRLGVDEAATAGFAQQGLGVRAPTRPGPAILPQGGQPFLANAGGGGRGRGGGAPRPAGGRRGANAARRIALRAEPSCLLRTAGAGGCRSARWPSGPCCSPSRSRASTSSACLRWDAASAPRSRTRSP